MPALSAAASLGGKPAAGATTVSPTRTVEVIGQPATRIGAGAPVSTGTTASPFALFPIAISNVQFAQAAQPGTATTRYTIDLPTSQSGKAPAQPSHLKASFVNLDNTGSGNQYYGAGQGNLAIDQLIGLIKYFSAVSDVSAIPPAAVERGVSVTSFDPADPIFVQRKQAIVSTLAKVVPGKTLLLPVVQLDPVLAGQNQVVGFARFNLVSAVNAAGNDFALVVDIGESVPERNASARDGMATIPAMTGALMPPPQAPFTPRSYQFDSNAVSIRPRGVVLAPAGSPRKLI
jgi:hypothetical protein